MAELEDVTLDGKPLNSLRVADLKTALEKRGLPKSGQKNALIKRLKGALMLENLQKTSTPHIGLQPNSQIGAEMSQNSFIQQYLAKQQELLRQRLEREALDAAENEAGMDSPTGGEEEDNTDASDNTSFRPEHSIMPSHPSLMDTHEGRGLDRDGPPRAVASLSVRVVGEPERQGPALHIPQIQASQSTTYSEAGSAQSVLQHSRFAQAVSQSAQEESDEDDDDDDDSEEDEEWGPAAGKRGGRKAAAPQFLPTPQRSRRKLQPPQHIPPQPALQPPLQLRQPTPPPSPPLELSFPLPDTPKQSPPDLNQAGVAGAEGPPAGLQRQDSSSSSRSSSPEPPAKLGRGPLSLLVRKMESEGAFDEEAASASAAGQKAGVLPAGLGMMLFPGGAQSTGGRMVSPGTQPASLSHGSESIASITFSSGAPTRGVITTLVEKEKAEHLQGPQEEERRKKQDEQTAKGDQDRPEHGQQASSKTSQPLADAPLTFPSSTVASSPPPVPKRRTFSDVPPPQSLLLSPTKSEPVCSGASAIPLPTARGPILFSGHQQTPQPPVTESPAEAETPKQAERQHVSEGSSQAASLLPPSPPPDDTEAERKGRGKQRGSKRPSSASSDSSSSDSDSSSSGSSDSRDKSSSVSQKKGKQEQRRSGKGDGREFIYREVKQSALSESADPAAVELEMEEVLNRAGAQGQTDARAEPESSEELSDKSTTVKGLPTRKISLSTSKTSPGDAESGAAETESLGGASRKRRWGSSTSVTAKKPSIIITTESLKSLIPDIKIPEEAVVELHPEDGCLSGAEESVEHQDRESDKDLKIRRTVTQVVPAEETENGQAEQDEEEEEEPKEGEAKRPRLVDGTEISLDAMEKQGEAKKVSPSDSVTRRSISQQKSGVSVTIDDPVQVSKQPSPPRSKVSKIVHVRNLVRPFTLGQLKELLGRTGTVVEEGFWIDKIKSHCFVTYSSTEEAVATREALHGVKWPLSNPKVLSVDFCEQEELDFHKGLKADGSAEERGQQAAGAVGRAPGPPPLMASLERGPAGGVRDQWAEREREMQRRERTRSEREWDRDKVREFAKAGEEREGRRSRSRDRERRRRERGKSHERKPEKKSEEKKAPEEPPAKLLDDLFHKTKAAPCIYWLPLSDEQAVQRDLKRAERRKERERRQKELDEEEKKQQEEKKEKAQGRSKDGGGAAAAAAAPAAAGGGGAVAVAAAAPAAAAGRPGERDRQRDRERERERDRERDRERERERERDRGRDQDRGRDGHGDRRRDSYRSRGSDARPSSEAGASRRSRSRSNPSRDRRH